MTKTFCLLISICLACVHCESIAEGASSPGFSCVDTEFGRCLKKIERHFDVVVDFDPKFTSHAKITNLISNSPIDAIKYLLETINISNYTIENARRKYIYVVIFDKSKLLEEPSVSASYKNTPAIRDKTDDLPDVEEINKIANSHKSIDLDQSISFPGLPSKDSVTIRTLRTLQERAAVKDSSPDDLLFPATANQDNLSRKAVDKILQDYSKNKQEANEIVTPDGSVIPLKR